MKRQVQLFTSFLVTMHLAGCTTTMDIPCNLDIEPIQTASALMIEKLDSVPRRNSQRQGLVISTFEALGCTVVMQPLSYGNSSNVICQINGTSTEEILISAHHDSQGSGKGIADNWSGITVLFSLVKHYLAHPPIHTLKFVAFADEENDMKGSYHYLKEVRQGRTSGPRLVVNIDTVGIDQLKMGHRSDKDLACVARSSADSLGLSLNSTRLRDMTGDWEPFSRAGIPTLHFHSLNEKTMRLLHTYRDRRDLVDDQKFTEAYQVIANTVAALDHGMDLVTRPLH